jgi:hypothetical protein
MGLQAQMDSGPAINSSNGRYRAGTADIALTKIVSLPDDQLGFRFVISAPSLRGGCCSVFPRIALAGQTDVPSSDGTYEIDVAEDPTSVATARSTCASSAGVPSMRSERSGWTCLRSAYVASARTLERVPGYSTGSSTNTGICRSVFVWYVA